MNYLSVEEVSKHYGEKILFDKVSFGLEKGQKLALVARNGAGKTSLLKVITGKDTPDSGKVVIRKDISVGYLEQDPVLNPELTVFEAVFTTENPVLTAIKNYESAVESSNSGISNDTELSSAIDRMNQLNAWDYEARVKQVLGKLDLHDLNKQIGELSGGQKRRVALAMVLIQNHDLLVLDEPTNHLDLDMVEWLEEFLTRQDLSLLLVTHDRYFLERVCDEIVELEGGKLFYYKGNYSYFLEKKAERENARSVEIDKARNIYWRELEWMRKMPKARGTKSKSRIDSFYRVEEKATKKKQESELKLNVKMSRVGGKILELKKVYKSFGDNVILKGFDYTFRSGERIGVIGRNGTGKSTFLNLITGKENADSGKVNVGETIVFGYFSQQGLVLKEDKRVIEVVKDIGDVIPMADGSKVSASQLLQLFHFSPDMQYSFVSKLSGGERRRLHLLTVLIKNPNFLILDEPTNDLDLLTLNTLEEFLLNFPGCLIIVSHDRYFMDKLVDHLFVFEGAGNIRDFSGNYSEYREAVEEEKEKGKGKEKEKGRVDDLSLQDSSTSFPEKDGQDEKARKASFKEKAEFSKLEKEIEELEKLKSGLEQRLASETNHAKLQEISEELGKIISSIEKKSNRWMELADIIL